jgi:hypothetical protein
MVDMEKVLSATDYDQQYEAWQTGADVKEPYGYNFDLNPDEAVVVRLIADKRMVEAGIELKHGTVAAQVALRDSREKNYERKFDGDFLSYSIAGYRKIANAWRRGRLA